jgi:uncharacterized membrane protein YfcA
MDIEPVGSLAAACVATQANARATNARIVDRKELLMGIVLGGVLGDALLHARIRDPLLALVAGDEPSTTTT